MANVVGDQAAYGQVVFDGAFGSVLVPKQHVGHPACRPGLQVSLCGWLSLSNAISRHIGAIPLKSCWPMIPGEISPEIGAQSPEFLCQHRQLRANRPGMIGRWSTPSTLNTQ